MLDFATHMKKVRSQSVLTEADVAAPAPVDSERTLHSLKIDLENLKRNIPKEIDTLIGQLKVQLIPTQTTDKRGVWDSMKNWWPNMWRGKYNDNNPYYYQNRFGELGRKEESIESEHI